MSRFAILPSVAVRGPWRYLPIAPVFFVLGCASTAQSGVSNSPDAEATSVRRTTVAEVQRIVAGNFSVTPTAEPTSTPPPTCAGAIWWHEARDHVGESRTVQGPVVAARTAPNAAIALEIGQRYPDPTGLLVLAPAGTESRVAGRSICVAGRIANASGSTTIDLRDASAIVVVN
jgi:hypothetical protein